MQHRLFFQTLIWVSALFPLFTSAAFGLERESEQLGQLSLTDFLVEPVFRSTESEGAPHGFGIGHSFVASEWRLDRQISGQLKVGSSELVPRPRWLGSFVTQLAFVEAYAQHESGWGTFRAGLIPIQFGLEGSLPEARLWFPRGKVFSEREILLRDYGVSYSIENNGIFTDVAAHNGEGAEDLDRRFWQTARWGWRGGAGIETGLSGAVGNSQVGLTSEVENRMANFFFGLNLYAIGLSAEGTVGERKSRVLQTQFYDWYASIRHALGRNWGGLLRFEHYDPSTRIPEDVQKQGLVGLYVNNDTNTSRLTLFFVRNWEEGEDQIANDEVRLTWRLTSTHAN